MDQELSICKSYRFFRNLSRKKFTVLTVFDAWQMHVYKTFISLFKIKNPNLKKGNIHAVYNVANYCYKNILIINMVILVNNTAFVFLVINSFLPDLANQPTPQKYNVKI